MDREMIMVEVIIVEVALQDLLDQEDQTVWDHLLMVVEYLT
jgi:hypothetical protein